MVLGNPIPSSVDPIGWLFFIWYIMLDLDCHFRCTSLPRFLAMLLSQATNTQRRWQWMATDLALQIQRIVVDCWESKLVQKMTWFWMRNLSQDSSGKWRFIGIHCKNVAILVVIVPGGSNPIVCLLHITTKVCRFHGSQFIQFHSNEKTQMNKTWASMLALYFAFTKKHTIPYVQATQENLQIYNTNYQTVKLPMFARSNFECLRCPSSQMTTTFGRVPNRFSSQFLIWPWHEFLWLWYIPCLQNTQDGGDHAEIEWIIPQFQTDEIKHANDCSMLLLNDLASAPTVMSDKQQSDKIKSYTTTINRPINIMNMKRFFSWTSCQPTQ